MRFQPKGDKRKTCVEECAVFDVRGIAPVRPCVAVQVYHVVAGQPYTPTVRLTTTPTFVRGVPQPWFMCPHCQRRCGRLYLPPRQAALRCRLCWDLQYRSQTCKNWRVLKQWSRQVPRDPRLSPIALHRYVWADPPPRERRSLAPWLRMPLRAG